MVTDASKMSSVDFRSKLTLAAAAVLVMISSYRVNAMDQQHRTPRGGMEPKQAA
jgi:hypothetical protein